jgi:hypothetical protein
MRNAPTGDDTGGMTAWTKGPVVVATMALAVLAAACGRSPGSVVAQVGSTTAPPGRSPANGPGSSDVPGPTAQLPMSAQMLPFSRCMRAHGVADFPDATSSVKFPGPRTLGVSDSQFQAAEGRCRHLLPNGGQPAQAASPQLLSKVLEFARCMRAHGLPGWPDPTPTPSGPVPYTFNLMGERSFDPRSAQVSVANNKCMSITGLGLNGPPPFGLERPGP